MATIIYPVAAHWVWNTQGWMFQNGLIDLAGSGVVHVIGGFAGFANLVLIGKRYGRVYYSNIFKIKLNNYICIQLIYLSMILQMIKMNSSLIILYMLHWEHLFCGISNSSFL